MKIINKILNGLIALEGASYADDRGYFLESYNSQVFKEIGINDIFVQDNVSLSKPAVIRGLHYQVNKPQSKFVRCLQGAILDVAVDIRPDSKTYGEHFSILLSAENNRALYIAEGFAHGFSVVGNNNALVAYKVNNFYNPGGDRGIIYNDPSLKIDWQVNNPILSSKDALFETFTEYSNNHNISL